MQDDNKAEEIRPAAPLSPDWQALRLLSLQPGGFRTRRVELWPLLLRARPHSPKLLEPDNPIEANDRPVHRDERQIKLDTERSFVLYPVDMKEDRDLLQAQLHDLLISIFQLHPRLNYFQGYHDIVTVLFLTLPPELRLPCAEKLSLHRVRDSMGASLEPILGLLRVMKRLLRASDPTLASILERNSPLPYYALSNLLTLFSHDMPTLPLAQHVFDYLLCRPPIFVVYLATAIVLSRKSEVERLEEDEEGMIHSLLSGLPEIHDEVEHVSKKPANEEQELASSTLASDVDDLFQSPGDKSQPELDPSETLAETTVNEGPIDHDRPLVDGLISTSNKLEPESAHAQDPLQVPLPPSPLPDTLELFFDPFSETPLELDTHIADDDEKPPLKPPASPLRVVKPQVSLSSLLEQADRLFAQFPPAHPDIALSSIMGPQSVMFTWSENKADMPSDSDAEKMVDRPDLVVPPVVEDEEENGKEAKEEDAEKPRRRHKLRKRKPSLFGRMDKRAVVTSAVLVLGVAVAVYGVRGRIPGGAFPVGEGPGHGKDLRRLGAWVGGALLGASARLLHAWT